MKSKYTTGKFSPIAKSFEFMKKEYGMTTNQARSQYFKTKKALLKNIKGASPFSSHPSKEIGNVDYITYNVITGQTNISEIDKDWFYEQTIEKFSHSKDENRKSFITKYGNDEKFKAILERYEQTKDYETFKKEVEEFKKQSTEYLTGSP